MKKKNKKKRKASQRPRVAPTSKSRNNRANIANLSGAVFELQSDFGRLIMEIQEKLRPVMEMLHAHNAVLALLTKEMIGRDLSEDERDALVEFLDGADEEE